VESLPQLQGILHFHPLEYVQAVTVVTPPGVAIATDTPLPFNRLSSIGDTDTPFVPPDVFYQRTEQMRCDPEPSIRETALPSGHAPSLPSAKKHCNVPPSILKQLKDQKKDRAATHTSMKASKMAVDREAGISDLKNKGKGQVCPILIPRGQQQ
jgi:hypothetical protein